MQKGIELATRDFKSALVEMINGSGLPPSLIGYILKDMMVEVEGIARNMTQKEEQEYQEKLEQNKKNEGKEKK